MNQYTDSTRQALAFIETAKQENGFIKRQVAGIKCSPKDGFLQEAIKVTLYHCQQQELNLLHAKRAILGKGEGEA